MDSNCSTWQSLSPQGRMGQREDTGIPPCRELSETGRLSIELPRSAIDRGPGLNKRVSG